MLRLKSHLLQSCAQAPSLQMAHGIGAKLNTRPLLRPRQLVFPHLQLQGWPMRGGGALRQGQGCSQAPNTPTRNQHLQGWRS